MDSAGKLRELLQSRVVFLDGAMGTMLMRNGMPAGASPELWAFEHRSVLSSIHRAYLDAGSDIVLACTFGGSRFHLGDRCTSINTALAETALEAADGRAIAAASIGPSGKLIYPVGDTSWTDVYQGFLVQAKALVSAGIRVFFLETFTDPRQLKAAVLAVRDVCPDGFISAHLTFAENGRSGAGTSPTALAVLCEQLAVDAAGANCSTGPEGLLPVISQLAATSSKYITVEPNAGLPDSRGNYSMTPELFAAATEEMAWAGATIIGGCCGTTCEHIRALRNLVGIRTAESIEKRPLKAFTSVDRVVSLGGSMLMVGESLNPTGRKELKKAIRAGDHDFIVSVAHHQEKADLLDINLGLERLVPEGLVRRVIANLCTGAPLSIDLSRPDMIKTAFQELGGIGLLNSLMATEEHIAERVSVLLRHGGYAVLLPIDENGLSDDPLVRLSVLTRGLDILKEHGFPQNRVLADPIVKAVATGADPEITLETLKLFKKEGLLTIAGVSNVSHGLPHRSGINAAFLSMLACRGLDAGIVNVNSPFTEAVTAGAGVLSGRVDPADIPIPDSEIALEENHFALLEKALIRGNSTGAAKAAENLLKKGTDAKEIVEKGLAPAMDRLGHLYAVKKLFLPHLIAGAEAAKILMSVLEPHLKGETSDSPGTIVLATVKGDIHDIGKNLVGLFLKNAGFRVVDLGKDIDSSEIVKAAVSNSADVVALSALMSTTASRMEEVIKLMREKKLDIPVLVGGAVVTEEFASEIGAEYGGDAYSAVDKARNLLNS